MDDLCDLTPPSSPETTKRTEQLSPETDPVFSCKGTVNPGCQNNLSSEGYLISGAFRKVLTRWKQPDDYDCCDLFGMTFVTSSLIYKSDTVFSLAKKCVSTLHSFTLRNNSSSGQDIKARCFHLRKQLFNFLCHTKYSLLRFSKSHNCSQSSINVSKLIENFLNCWKELLLFIGRLSDLSDHIIQSGVSRNGNSSLLSSYHLFHLYLDIWWTTAEIIYIIDTFLCGCGTNIEVVFSRPLIPGFDGFFSQLILILLWDLCSLSVKKHNQLQVSDYFTVTPFTCTCTYEIWIMVIHLIEFRQKWKKEDIFSSYIHCIFQSLVPSVQNTVEENDEDTRLDIFLLKPESLKCVNPIGFCMWMLTHLSSLCKYDYYGNYMPSAKVCTNYFGTQKIINLFLVSQSEHRNEAHLRFFLQCCHVLAENWNANSDLILPFIEFFLKKLDDSFHQRGLGLKGLQLMSKSGESWVEEVKRKICSAQQIKSTDTSFDIFLRLLSLTLQKSQNEGAGIWKQVKGRIYSKFHVKRVKDLSEIGLYNCLTVFIVLALSVDLEDVTSKVCDLADMINKGNVGVKKQIVSWKSLFALITIYQDNKKNASIVIKQVSCYFHQVCMMCSENDNQQQSLMSLVMIYLEGVQNVIESCSNLTSNEYSLIEKGFDTLLLKFAENEIGPLLTMVECILKKICQLQKNCSSEMVYSVSPQSQVHLKYVHTLCDQVLPFLRVHATTTAPLPQVSTISSMLTWLSAEMTSFSTTSLFTQLFYHFGTNNINANVMCDYLCLLFQNDQLAHCFTKEHYYAAIKSWFRCGLCILPPSDKMQQFTQLIFRFPQFPPSMALLKNQSELLNHDDIMVHFFCNIAKNFQSPEERAQAKNDLQHFLQGFVTSLPGLLRTTLSKEMVSHIYNLNSNLVEHCAPLLYEKSNSDSLLVTVINELILPRSLYAKEMPALLLNTIERHMDSFLRGIIKIKFSTDHYLQRKLKEIIIQYLYCFEVKRSNQLNFVHPLLTAFLQLPSTSTEFFIFTIDAIRDNVIRKGVSSVSQFLLGISFITEVFCRSSTTNKKIMFPKVLQLLLEQMLVTDDHGAYQKLIESVSLILRLCEKEFGSDFRACFLLPSLNTFLENHLAWKTNRVFRLIKEITIRHPELLADFIPVVSKQVQAVEEKRGIGLDQSLRHGLTMLLKVLNEKQTEK